MAVDMAGAMSRCAKPPMRQSITRQRTQSDGFSSFPASAASVGVS